MNRSYSILRAVTCLILSTALCIAPAIAGNNYSPLSPPEVAVKAKPYSWQPSKQALNWANRVLRKMTLDQKVGQLVSVGVNATFLNQDSEAFQTLKRQVEVNHVGGIILFRGPVYESVVLMNRMQQFARHPLLISADLEAGAGMRFDDTVNFPWNMAVGALFIQF